MGESDHAEPAADGVGPSGDRAGESRPIGARLLRGGASGSRPVRRRAGAAGALVRSPWDAGRAAETPDARGAEGAGPPAGARAPGGGGVRGTLAAPRGRRKG